MLQLLRWRCVECVVHHERDAREEQKYLCVVRASNDKRDCEDDVCCCLLPQCEALRTCRSGFAIPTLTTKPVLEIYGGGQSPCRYDGGVNLPRSIAMHRSLQKPVGLKFLSARRSGRTGTVKQWIRSRHIEVHSNVGWIRSIWTHSKFSSFFSCLFILFYLFNGKRLQARAWSAICRYLLRQHDSKTSTYRGEKRCVNKTVINQDAQNWKEWQYGIDKERWAPRARNRSRCKYVKAVERKSETASYNCRMDGRFSLAWPNKSKRFHAAGLSLFSWDNVNTCSFKWIFMIEFDIT